MCMFNAQVYKAMMAGSTLVAVKVVLGQSRKEQERFQREVDILKSLRHTNIVQFLDASIVGGQIMLVTEYMSRGDLWTALSHDHNHLLSWHKRCARLSQSGCFRSRNQRKTVIQHRLERSYMRALLAQSGCFQSRR